MMTIRPILFFLVLLAPGLAQAQVTTLAQQEAIYTSVIQSAQSNPAALIANAKSLVPQYGNYCGFQSTAPGALPIDGVDGACAQHDASAGYSSVSPTLSQVAQADQQLIANLTFTQAATPYGELYRNGAIQLFEAKTTFEQANQTVLYPSCSDCPPQP